MQVAPHSRRAKTPSSPGERLVAAYLRQRRIRYQFEPDVEGRHPDFLIDHPLGSVACDVAEPTMRLPSPRGGAFSSYPALRQVFTNKRKRKQAQAAAKAGLPFMHVLARTNSDTRGPCCLPPVRAVRGSR
jgi:hypothetical protein